MASFKGRPFFRLTCCSGDIELSGAPAPPKVEVHQGWTQDYRPPLHQQIVMNWSIGIPEDYYITPAYAVCLPPNIHSVNLGPSPLSCWIYGNVIRFAISVDDPAGKPVDAADDIYMTAVTDIPFTPGDIFDFQLNWISSGGSDGYCVLHCNGEQIMDYKGPTLCTKEACVVDPTQPVPYINHMLYVNGATAAEAWPIQARSIYYLPWEYVP